MINLENIENVLTAMKRLTFFARDESADEKGPWRQLKSLQITPPTT
jgi:hypothetical protein